MRVQVGLKYGLPLLSPVDDAGVFTAEAGQAFVGKAILGEGNAAVAAALREAGCLLKVQSQCCAHSLIHKLSSTAAAGQTFVGRAILGEENAAVAAALRDTGCVVKV